MLYKRMSQSDQLIEFFKIHSLFEGWDFDTSGDTEEQIFHRTFHVGDILQNQPDDAILPLVDRYLGFMRTRTTTDMIVVIYLILLHVYNFKKHISWKKTTGIQNITKVGVDIVESEAKTKELMMSFHRKYGSPMVDGMVITDFIL